MRRLEPWESLRPSFETPRKRAAPQTVCPFAERRRLTLDASARVTRIGRAEPHAGKVVQAADVLLRGRADRPHQYLSETLCHASILDVGHKRMQG